MTDPDGLLIAHTSDEVVLWRSPHAGQRVVRLHVCGPTLRHELAERGAKPVELHAVWLSRDGFDAMLTQTLVDPQDAGKIEMCKVIQAQHRLATRFAQVRLCFSEQRDVAGQPSGHRVACFSLRNAARHRLRGWVVRTETVALRAWDEHGLPKMHRLRSYPLDPALWGWSPA